LQELPKVTLYLHKLTATSHSPSRPEPNMASTLQVINYPLS
jgi:hypothetical protein